MNATAWPWVLVATSSLLGWVTSEDVEAHPPQDVAVPDLTRGGSLPEGWDHDWTLGATGARGWMYCDRLVTTDARQIAITQVDESSPADGILAVGDVLVGVSGKRFSFDPRVELGRALTAAESDAGKGALSLIRWRDGRTETVTLQLPVLGSYVPTAPYDCAKSRRILERGCEALAARMAEPSYRPRPIPRCLNALALLASGEPDYLPLVRREATWAAGFSADGFQTWYYGYVMMLLAEYVLATGDDAVMPGLRRLATEAAEGQSLVGSWGHRFAMPDGRLAGYGMMNAPGVPLTIALVMARAAGIEDEAVDLAIDRSLSLLRFYVGKGAIPYGDHHPWIQTHEDNGKCGMGAVLFDLVGEAGSAAYFSRMSLAAHGSERDTGHTGNYWNLLWSLPGIARSGAHASGAWMQEFGGWYFDLARRWDGTFLHQGPPEPKPDKYGGWDATGAYLLSYALPLRKILLTGRGPSRTPHLDAEAARATVHDGRGWTNKDRNGFYDALGEEELLKRLESWSPVVRQRAAVALGRRKNAVLPALVALLDSPRLEARYGACQALEQLRWDAAPAVAALHETLQHPDLWLRVQAANALASIGEAALPTVPTLLEMLARPPSKEDPRGMEQRYLCFALFQRRGGMLNRSLDGIDRDALFTAVRAGLGNQDGRARGALSSVYHNLTFEELRPLLPAIHAAILESAPSGIMFADQIRVEGLRLLAKHRVAEGIDACAHYVRHMKAHGSQKRVPEILEILLTYGAHAQKVVPDLERTALYFEQEEKDFPRRLSLQKAQAVRDAIRAITAAEARPELVRIR